MEVTFEPDEELGCFVKAFFFFDRSGSSESLDVRVR